MKSYVEKLKESNKKRLINHGVRLENELREKRLNSLHQLMLEGESNEY